jgi:hypothetical protein
MERRVWKHDAERTESRRYRWCDPRVIETVEKNDGACGAREQRRLIFVDLRKRSRLIEITSHHGKGFPTNSTLALPQCRYGCLVISGDSEMKATNTLYRDDLALDEA